MIENGLIPEQLLGGKYGRHLHVWDLRRRKHIQEIDLGPEYQLIFELRQARDPTKAYGFVGVVISLKDLSSSIWLWHRANGSWAAKKVIDIPAEPAEPDQLPPLLKGFKAVAPLLTDINLSLDDKFLYASCWGTGEMRQYDVSDPYQPKLTGSVHIGGIVKRSPHPASGPVNGGPQMVEVSRDGRRVYLTNSLYSPWDAQFYPDGIRGWLAKFDVGRAGGLALDQNFLVEFEDGMRPHQVRLQGGDASSDSFCFS
jgi:selenium-binding protein 1